MARKLDGGPDGEAGFRRWQFIASATVLLAAIGLALKAWLKW
jgi:hypothetical protein